MTDGLKTRTATIAGVPVTLTPRGVRSAMRRLEPEPIRDHYVVIGVERYPPKQVIAAVTGHDRADFTTHQARRTLMRMGFLVGRQQIVPEKMPGRSSTKTKVALDFSDLGGRWVAVRGEEILHQSASATELVRWLTRHDQAADRMFRVPTDEVSASGAAPL